LIGGKIDEEEGQSESNIEDVAKREFIEETGYSGKIELIPAYIFETPNKSFKYYNFIGLIDNEFNPQIDWETEYFKWVTFDEMMKIEPKHFGLKALLNDTKSLSIIKKYSK
jgi:8-oxo-dGTP pyrophosphatase MutT (NUDIX family)